jgi:PAS domain S-box-containing protein
MEISDLSLENLLREQRRLLILEAVTRETRQAQEITEIGKRALSTLYEHLPIKAIYLYHTDAQQQLLRFVNICPSNTSDIYFPQAIQQFSIDSLVLEARVACQREPLLIEDLRTSEEGGELEENLCRCFPDARGCVCIPLWFRERCEGTLTALFDMPLDLSHLELEIAILRESGEILSSAIFQAHVYNSVMFSRPRLFDMADHLPEGVLVAESSAGTITYANEIAAQMLGHELKDLVGMAFHTASLSSGGHFQGRPLRPWNFALTRAFCGEIVHAQETMITRSNGETCFLLCSSAPLRENRGDIVEAILVFQDISLQVELDQQRSAFVAMASHELRTPVTVIQGFADLLLVQAKQGKELEGLASEHALETIVQHSEILVRLVDEMLDLTHLDKTNLPLNYTKIDLIALLRSILDVPVSLSGLHHISLKLEGNYSSEQLWGWFDEERLRQILNNLLSNASKYSPAASDIEVGLKWSKSNLDEVLLWVRDEGIGISAEEQPHIFQRFYRGRSLDHSLSGLGLGLYLVKELVTRLSGRIWVESKAEKGSTFFVSLPMQQQQIE